MKSRCRLVAVSIVTLLLMSVGFAAKGIDPRRVSVLYPGDAFPGVTPYLALKEDAFILVAPIRAYYHGGGAMPLKDVHKFMRLYMPRNYQDFIDKYDVLLLSDAYRRAFTPAQHLWFKNCVIDQGFGLAMIGGLDSFWASSSRPEANWHGSFTEEVLPIEIPTGKPVIKHNWIRQSTMVVTDPSHEFMSSLPFQPKPRYMKFPVDGQLVWEKPGASILARWVNNELGNPPLYVTWDVGNGRTFAMMHDWSNPGGEGGGVYFSQWEYYRDYAIDLMLYLAKRPMYPDFSVVHMYREQVHVMSMSKSLLLYLIDFIDKFGGNSRPIDRDMIALDSMVEDFSNRYLDHDFENALTGVRSALGKIEEMEQLSVRMKNQALMWVFVVEWLSVTGVSLMSGFVLWTVMIRKRLYREVQVTRSPALR